MPVETPTGVQDLNPSWPTSVDPISEGDDHDRLTKLAIQQSFPNMTGPWTTTSQVKANGFDANANRIVNVATPVDATDAARKGETDALSNRVGNLEQQASKYASFGTFETTAGDAVNIIGGSGDWSIVRTAEGSYTITFAEAAAGQYEQSLVASSFGVPPFSLPRAIDVFPLSATQFGVFVWRTDTTALVDSNLTFIRLAN